MPSRAATSLTSPAWQWVPCRTSGVVGLRPTTGVAEPVFRLRFRDFLSWSVDAGFVATSEATFVATSIRVATSRNPQVVYPHDPLELGNPPSIPLDHASLLGNDGQERIRIVAEMP